MEFDNKLRPIQPNTIDEFDDLFGDPFGDKKTYTQLVNELQQLDKIDLVKDDGFNKRDPEKYRGKAWKHFAPSPYDITNDELNEYDRRVAPLTDLSSVYKNIYTNPQPDPDDLDYYEYGTDMRDYFELEMDRYTHEVIKRTQNNPEADVIVYRVMPKNTRAINEGDWVTVNPQYALMFFNLLKDHSQSKSRLPKNYHIVAKKVKAKDLYSGKRDDTDDIHSFGYYPK